MFIDYLKTWFRGPLDLKMVLREIGISKMDNTGFTRETSTDAGLDLVLGDYLKKWSSFNWYLSNAYTMEINYSHETVLFDRFAFDFDNPNNPWEAVAGGLRFAQRIEEAFGAKALVVESGFKGAYVYVFLSEPQPWSAVEKLWSYLVLYAPPQARKMIDKSMNQWNRVCRIPLTYNLKKGERKLAKIIYPEEIDDYSSFTWSTVKPLDASRIQIPNPQLPPLPEIVKIKRKMKPEKSEKRWIMRVVESGLPDGRKRFLLMVLIPYLAVVKGVSEEDVLAVCNEFVENSCRNFSKCDKIYDSWMRSAIRSAKSHGFRGFSLKKLREKDPELHSLIESVLTSGRSLPIEGPGNTLV